MTEIKQKSNKAVSTKFLDSISDDAKRTDSYTIVEMLRTATKLNPKCGEQHHWFRRLPLRRQEWSAKRWLLAGMSARKQNLTLSHAPVAGITMTTCCELATLARQGLFIINGWTM